MARLIDSSIPKFLLVGVGNTLLSLFLMFLLEGLGYWPSTAIAYVAGAVMSFFLNRSFTFKSRADFWPSALKFTINVAVCYVIAYSVAQPLAAWVLGRTARVTETIDNDSAAGAVYVDGKTWTARSADGAVIPAGARVRIQGMEGVKLLVRELAEEETEMKTEKEETR